MPANDGVKFKSKRHLLDNFLTLSAVPIFFFISKDTISILQLPVETVLSGCHPMRQIPVRKDTGFQQLPDKPMGECR